MASTRPTKSSDLVTGFFSAATADGDRRRRLVLLGSGRRHSTRSYARVFSLKPRGLFCVDLSQAAAALDQAGRRCYCSASIHDVVERSARDLGTVERQERRRATGKLQIVQQLAALNSLISIKPPVWGRMMMTDLVRARLDYGQLRRCVCNSQIPADPRLASWL
jgi:hypothetical protein